MNISKFVWCLFGFQTLLILFLAFQTSSLVTQVQDLAVITNNLVQGVPAANLTSDQKSVDNAKIYQADNSIMIKEIRDVIAKEIQNIHYIGAIQTNEVDVNSALTHPRLSQNIVDQMSADVSGMIAALHAQDLVGASEIASVEQAIVKLPPTERRHALQELFKAVNSGQINTRF